MRYLPIEGRLARSYLMLIDAEESIHAKIKSKLLFPWAAGIPYHLWGRSNHDF